MPGTKIDSRERITVRNLRIREDTAKYLLNLDIGSAYYDPKTRSMREDPLAGKKSDKPSTFHGENAIRYSDETRKIAQSHIFAWNASDRGVDVHLNAEPTKLEMMKDQFDKGKVEVKSSIEQSILSKYGGDEYFKAPPAELIYGQNERYVEYSRSGKIVKGEEEATVRSKYVEDEYPNNHTSVYGSYWRNGKWGYRCCHSMIKNSVCVGAAGLVEEETVVDREEVDDTRPDEIPAEIEKKQPDSQKYASISKPSKEIDPEKLKLALAEEDKRRKAADEILSQDERKRDYTSMYDEKSLTAEQIEAYQMKRIRSDDPMAKYFENKD